jgi:hypothetical protein
MGSTEDAALFDMLRGLEGLEGDALRAKLLEIAQESANASSSAEVPPPLFVSGENLFDFTKTELVRLDRLPFPSDWRAHAQVAGENVVDLDAGYGLGSHLNDTLGGGLGRGEMVVIGAAGPGAGKTYLVGQLCEGLALRSAAMMRAPGEWGEWCRTLTPVCSLSEMAPERQRSRAISRYTGLDNNVFRQGRHWNGFVIQDGKSVSLTHVKAQDLANHVMRPGAALAEISDWMRFIPLNSGSEPRAVIEDVKRRVGAMVRWLKAKNIPDGLDIIPVIFIDPLQRCLGTEDELRGLNTLIEHLADVAKAEGFAVVSTSDTNKDSSTGNAGGRAENEREARERGAKMLRGTNKVQHLVDVSAYLERDWEIAESAGFPKGFGEIEVPISKNRNGPSSPPYPRFRWHYQTGRMFACTQEYAKRAFEPDDSTDPPGQPRPITIPEKPKRRAQ